MTDKIILPHNHDENTLRLLSNKPSPDVFTTVSATFGLISDSTRLEILWLLCHSEECVMNIAAAVEMSSPAVSHHLRILKNSGLITSKRNGKEMYYRVADTPIAASLHHTMEQIAEISCPGGIDK